MKKHDEEILNFYGEQLEIIREINKGLKVDNNIFVDLIKSYRWNHGFLKCVIIVQAILIATGWDPLLWYLSNT